MAMAETVSTSPADHADAALPAVALVRPPLLSRRGALNNEAVPHIGLAYLGGALRAAGYPVTLLDGIAEGLNEVHDWAAYPGFQIQGITPQDLVARLPADTAVVGFSSMFSAEWLLLRELIECVRERFPSALLVGGGEHFTQGVDPLGGKAFR